MKINFLIFIFELSVLLIFLPNIQQSFADGFGSPIYKLAHNPTICAFESPSNATFPVLSDKLLSQTQYSVIDWQTKLNTGEGKHPHWNMNFIKVSLNQQPSFDIKNWERSFVASLTGLKLSE